MQTVICILGAVVPLVVVALIWAVIHAPLKRFLTHYFNESLASLAELFVYLVVLFYAVRLSVESLAGLRAGIGRFVSGVVGPGLSTCESAISLMMWVVNMAALFFIGRAILSAGSPGAVQGRGPAQENADRKP